MTAWTTRDRILGIVSALVALAGLVTLLVAVTTPVSFGWFAYAEVSDTTFTSGDIVVLSRSAVLGAAAFATGAIGVAFVLGSVHGTRRRRPDTDPAA
jgi:hypothetical protein